MPLCCSPPENMKYQPIIGLCFITWLSTVALVTFALLLLYNAEDDKNITSGYPYLLQEH